MDKLYRRHFGRHFGLYIPMKRNMIYYKVAFCICIFLLIYIFIFSGAIRRVPNGTYQSVIPWWKTVIIYEIYPRSFQDSDGDGIGDLKGIISRVNYLKDLGIGAVWLTPIYPSPMVDFGYDITNFTDIDPIYGSLKEFDKLLLLLHDLGIKLIMDFVPNHTSNLHPWFQKSIKKIYPYTNYYVWKDPKSYNKTGHPIPPNNWLSVQGSTWEWNEERQQFYLHHYEKEQPDLNVRFPAVMDELDKVIEFWLDRGVDGLRLDAIARLFEVENVYQDEPINENNIGKVRSNSRSYLKPIYTANQPETFEAIHRWRKIIHSYSDRVMLAEVSINQVKEVISYYGTETKPLSHFPFNFFLINELKVPSDVNGLNLKKVIGKWLDNIPEGKWPNWVLGNHDVHRFPNRMGTKLIDSMNMISLLMRGTPVTYYGEEIGMEDNTFITFEEAVDPRGILSGPENYLKYGRDPERTPMQWNSSKNAGFSTASRTWLPVNYNYEKLNVATQLESSQSHLKVYKSLTRLRERKTFIHGHFEYSFVSNDVFAFVRYLSGEDSYLIVVNTSNRPLVLDLYNLSTYLLPRKGYIVIRSSFDTRLETQPGSVLSLESLSILSKEGLVIHLLI